MDASGNLELAMIELFGILIRGDGDDGGEVLRVPWILFSVMRWL